MTTRRTTDQAEAFARAIDEPGAKGADPTLLSLAAVATALATIPRPPAPAFKESLRAMLMAEAAQVLPGSPPAPATPSAPAATPAPAPAIPAQPAAPALPVPAGASAGSRAATWLQAPAAQFAAGGFAAAVAVSGAGVAASLSMPGDPFYGLKRGVERLRLALAGDAVDEARALAGQATTRAGEVEALLDDALTATTVDALGTTIAALDASVRDAVERLLVAARAGDVSAYAELRSLLDELLPRVRAVRDSLPPELAPDAGLVAVRLAVADVELRLIAPRDGNPARPGPVDRPTVRPSDPSPAPVTTPVSPPPSVVPTPPAVKPSTPSRVSPSPEPSPVVVVPLPSLPVLPLPTITLS